MSDTLKEKTKKFLYVDENVKYSFTHDNNNNQLTIHCSHPIFVNRFGKDTVTMSLAEFLKTASKGSADYNFFEKFYTSLQEYFIDHDA